MKRIMMLGVAVLLTHGAWAGSVPNQITYQGTIKQAGVPVNGSVSMSFRLTNPTGTTVYWSSGNMSVDVRNGLFSANLNTSGVDWQNVTPYIELSVQGQVLLPREPLTSNAYALMSGGIVDGAVTTPKIADGAITQAKLDPAVQGLQIPAGLIAMFAGSCPAGWMRFTSLDGLFPMGGSTFGASGGSASHVHSISTDGAHNHGGLTGFETVSGDPRGSDGAWVARYHHQHSITTDGAPSSPPSFCSAAPRRVPQRQG